MRGERREDSGQVVPPTCRGIVSRSLEVNDVGLTLKYVGIPQTPDNGRRHCSPDYVSLEINRAFSIKNRACSEMLRIKRIFPCEGDEVSCIGACLGVKERNPKTSSAEKPKKP